MNKIERCAIPNGGLLEAYAGENGTYTDCYKVRCSGEVSLRGYIAAFFDTWLFRLERRLLAVTKVSGMDVAQVNALAVGKADHFAAWQVEARTDTQILLAVGQGPIRTWLCCIQDRAGTDLYFGSALLLMSTDGAASPKLGLVLKMLMPLHRVYSRMLLWTTVRALKPSKTHGY